MAEIGRLVQAARRGDQQAMTILYEQCYKRAYYLALQLVKDEDQAQDILQDSFVKAFSSLDSLQDPEKFQSWLGQIVTNRSKDYLKKKKPILFSQMVSEDEEMGQPDFEDESGQFSPDAAVDYRETKRLVQEMIDELPEEQRIAIVLRYLEEIPVKQIAQIMECSEGTVKSRLNYGRKAIRDKVLLLEKKGTKLYCMPLVPFLCWMHRQEAMAAMLPAMSGVGTAAAGISGAAGAASGAGAPGAAGASGAAGAVSGAGASGAAGAAGGAGASAGKAGLASVGKAVGMKAVAIGAAVVLGGAAVAGGVYVFTHPKTEMADTAGDAIGQLPERGKEQDETVSGDQEKENYVLTEEELALFRSLYDAAEKKDYGSITFLLQEHFFQIYQLLHEHFPGSYMAFDGQEAGGELEGYRLAFAIGSNTVEAGTNEGAERFYVQGSLGDFADGKPQGNLLKFGLTYCAQRRRPFSDVTFIEADYADGVYTETPADLEVWNGREQPQCIAEALGSYREGDEMRPFGQFEITLYKVYENWHLISKAGDNSFSFTEYDGPLSFSVTISEQDEDSFYEMYEDTGAFDLNADRFLTGILDMAWSYSLADNSGQWVIDSVDLQHVIFKAGFWSGKGSVHQAGTENLLPQEPEIQQEESAGAEGAQEEGDPAGEAQGEDTQAQEDTGEWKAAYREILQNELSQNWAGASLIYVDDEIPELYLYGSYSAQGDRLYTWKDGDLDMLETWNGTLSYLERENSISVPGGRMGFYVDEISSIANGKFQVKESGESGFSLDDDGNEDWYYIWEGENVSETEYQERLEQAFDQDRAIFARDFVKPLENLMEELDG